MSIGEPESQETFDGDFCTNKMTPQECMARVEEILVECRNEAGNLAKQWLLKHGYFNGEITSEVFHDDKAKTVKVVVTLTCFGLPQVRVKKKAKESSP